MGRALLATVILPVGLSLTGCTDPDVGVTATPVTPTTAHSFADRPFLLDPGHCWFEPVVIRGQIWVVEPADQFGWGDGVRWRGKGLLRQVADDHLVFVDGTGRRIDLWREGSPQVADDGTTSLCL